MTGADAFLDAIWAAPDDDTPRLVYAHWLEEHGHANYAQFIRLQCEVSHHELGSTRANELWVEIGRVWTRLTTEWWPAMDDEWPGLPGADLLRENRLDAIHFQRGFLNPRVAVAPFQVMRYVRCTSWLPTPECRFTIDDLATGLAPLGSDPLMRRLKKCWIDLDYGLWAEPIEPAVLAGPLSTFLRSPYLTRLASLDLASLSLNEECVETLLTAPSLAALKELRVLYFDCDSSWAVPRLRARFPKVIHG